MRTSWIVAAVLTLLCTTAHAQQTVSRKLTDFYQGQNPLRLQGMRDHRNLSVPLTGNKDVVSATLSLEVISSKALIEKRSILNVRFNNATIGQIPFDPNRPALSSEVTIPARLWREGFNTLTLGVSQHYAQQCVDGGAPELWSEVDLSRSVLTLITEDRQKAPQLRDLSAYFSPGIGAQQQVSVITPDNAGADVSGRALPVIAQALALRNLYSPLSVISKQVSQPDNLPALPAGREWDDRLTQRWFDSSWYVPDEQTGGLHVLAGTRETLQHYLGEATERKITGPYIGIEQTPAVKVADQILVPARTRLVISGQTGEQVVQAAQALALMDDAINPDASIIVDAMQSSSGASPLSAHILQPGNEYTFAQMGEGNNIMRGEDDFAKEVQLVLPADFYVPESASMTLNLDFGYGAAMGPGSMMNILVNGELVHGRPLNNENGESYRKYQLRIPARHLHGGINTLEFLVSMRSPITGEPCDDISGSHLLFQLRNTSSVVLPEAGQVARLPDLGLFSETGYPFASQDISRPIGMYLTDPQMQSAALTLAGKLAQTAGTLLPNLELIQGVRDTLTDNAIVLGTPDSLPADFAQTYGVSVAATKQWPYRLQNELHNRIHTLSDDKSHRPLTTHGTTTQQSSLGEMAVLVAQRNPRTEQGSLYIVAAQDSRLLTARIDDLVSLGLWGQLAGDFFSWQDRRAPLLAMQVAEKFEAGNPDDHWLSLRIWLSNNPWYWLIGVVLLVGLIMYIAVQLLRRRNKAVTEDW
ncbi:cellulose biosynthesis cyclic di-GMP-binding regulatory protein BcsB [Salinimonas lutimaris]|uniref:cellulose biosynthesis cyclic di-GMP-binding regulatory protein BcsB n=1 Tax=Salinimonas lutimaris TaxID=914153 RepID=UPI0010C019B1|nr:cellulose biosynthesis cyclic di-GMP-binding regulatory protein BcsB [Salinimonas lutimaris]